MTTTLIFRFFMGIAAVVSFVLCVFTASFAYENKDEFRLYSILLFILSCVFSALGFLCTFMAILDIVQ